MLRSLIFALKCHARRVWSRRPLDTGLSRCRGSGGTGEAIPGAPRLQQTSRKLAANLRRFCRTASGMQRIRHERITQERAP